MKIRTCILGNLGTNCYIICNDTNQAVIVDPADQAQEIQRQLERDGLFPAAILLTHGHFDHILAAAEVAAHYHIPVYACEAEKELLGDPRLNCGEMMGVNCSLIPDRLVKDGDIIKIADMEMEVIQTPGHTAGGVCYYFKEDNALIGGDTLFFESVGRTDFPTGNTEQLLASIREKLMVLPDDVIVYPGHGIRTTIGHERKSNPYLSEDNYWN